MRLNPSFDPAARKVLHRLEKDYRDLMSVILGAALRPAETQGAEDRLKDITYCYRENFYSQFKDETAFNRWLKTAAPKAFSLEEYYADECRALSRRQPSPAFAFEKTFNQKSLPRIEDEYAQFVQAYAAFQGDLTDPDRRAAPHLRAEEARHP